MDLFSLIVSILFFGSAFHLREDPHVKNKTTNYSVYIHQVIDSLKEQVAKEYGLRCYGRGASMPYDVVSISVDFQSNDEVTIEQSRELLVSVVEQFLRTINTKEEILPFLREYPFLPFRITLNLKFREISDKDNNDRIEHVLFVKNKVYYSVRDKKTFKHIDIHEETYEEALRIVHGQR